jgi:hypothetical protein
MASELARFQDETNKQTKRTANLLSPHACFATKHVVSTRCVYALKDVHLVHLSPGVQPKPSDLIAHRLLSVKIPVCVCVCVCVFECVCVCV